MHCTSCGAALAAGSKFCTSCGTPTPVVETPAPATDTTAPAPAAAAPPAAPAPAPAPPPTTYGQPAPAKAPLPPVAGGGFVPIGPRPENAFSTFFTSLFDLSFEKQATARIVKMLFILAIVGGGLWALLTFVSIASMGGAAAVVGLLVAPFFFVLFVAYTRILLELVLSVTRMEQHTRVLAEQARRDEPGTSEPR